MEGKKEGRRDYLKTVGAAIAGAIIGGALGWVAKPAAPGVTETVTVTKTVTAKPTPVKGTFVMSYPNGYAGHYIHLKEAFDILRITNPELRPEYVGKTWGEYYEWLLTVFAAGEPPDMPMIDCIWIPKFVELGYLEPLDEYIAEWPDWENWIPTFKEGMIWDGHVYGIWLNTDARVWWYWKEFFPEGFPSTLEDIIDKAKRLKAEGKPQIATWVGAAIYPFMCIYCSICPEDRLKSPGWGLFEIKDGKLYPIFDDEYGVRSMEYILEMKKAGIEFIDIPGFSASYDKFFEKKISALFAGTWMSGQALARGYKYEDWEKYFGVAPWPPPRGGRVHAGIPGGWVAVIPKNAKMPKDLIWEYIRILVDESVVGKVFAELGYLPTRRDAFDIVVEKSKDPFMDDYLSYFKNVYIRPEITEWERVSKAIDDAQWSVILERKKPDEAIKDAAKEVAEILGW